jgi:hypothetical protein
MSGGARRGARAAHIGQWLFAIGVSGSALAVGAVHTVTMCLVTAVLAVGMALVWWGAEPARVRPVATLLLVVGLALTAYTVLQCVPMPVAWLRHLSSYSANVWSRALYPLGEQGQAWAPLSLDPHATRIEALKGVAYVLAFVAAVRLARRREGVAFLSWIVMLTGLALAAAALIHPAFGVRKLYGLYDPGVGIEARHVAPLMNPNNLAGYLNLALCLALAASLAPEPRLPRPVMAAIALVLAATQVWVASRGGVVTMVIGAALVVAFMRVLRSKAQVGQVNALSVAAGIAAAGGGLLIALGGSDAVSVELLSADTTKLRLLEHVFGMLPSVPFFGCGRGAFESAYPSFRVEPGYYTFTQPENVVAQWVLEWGAPVGLLGLAAVAYALRPNVVLARSTTAVGAWGGLVAVATQNLGDLGTEIPGLMLACVVCAAIVVAGTPGRVARWRVEGWAKRVRVVVASGVCASAIAITVCGVAIGGELHRDQHAIHDAADSAQTTLAEMHSLARAAMERHPAEPYFPFGVALRALRARDESVVPWIGATLERATMYGPAHFVLARALVRRSPSQARLEYRLAIEQAPETTWSVMAEAPRVVSSFDDAMEVVPTNRMTVAVLDSMAVALGNRLPATAVRLDAELLRQAPDFPDAIKRAASRSVEDLEGMEAASWCSGDQRPFCLSRAVKATERAQGVLPRQCEPYVLRARASVAAGEPMIATRDLEAAADKVDDRLGCLRELVTLAESLGDDATVSRAVDKVVRGGCSEDAACVQNFVWAAQVEERRRQPAKALMFYKKARARAPEDDYLLQQMATLASKTGLHVEAAEDYRLLSQRHPDQPAWLKAAQGERNEAARTAGQL